MTFGWHTGFAMIISVGVFAWMDSRGIKWYEAFVVFVIMHLGYLLFMSGQG